MTWRSRQFRSSRRPQLGICAVIGATFGVFAALGPARAQPARIDRDPLGFIVPDFAKLQSGGYSGTATLGLGYSAFEDRLNVAGLYGYVPPGSGRAVKSLHFLVSLRPLELGPRAVRWLPIYPGFGALCTWGPGYFLTPPKRYPPNYYYPTALRFTAHIGSELDWLPAKGAFERHGVYVELTTLDVFAFEYIKNPRFVDLTDIVSSSIGYRVAF